MSTRGRDSFMLNYGSSKNIHEVLDKGMDNKDRSMSYTRALQGNDHYDRSHVDKLLASDDHRLRAIPFHVGKHIEPEDMDKHIHDESDTVKFAVLNQSWNPDHFTMGINHKTGLKNPFDRKHMLETAMNRGILNKDHINVALKDPDHNVKDRAIQFAMHEKYKK